MDPGGYGAPLPVILTLRAGSNRHEVPNLDPLFDPSPPRTPVFASPAPTSHHQHHQQQQVNNQIPPPVPHTMSNERYRTSHPVGFSTISGEYSSRVQCTSSHEKGLLVKHQSLFCASMGSLGRPDSSATMLRFRCEMCPNQGRGESLQSMSPVKSVKAFFSFFFAPSYFC